MEDNYTIVHPEPDSSPLPGVPDGEPPPTWNPGKTTQPVNEG